MMGIIYCAENSINGKRYIGQTISALNKRMRVHRYAAAHNPQSYFHKALRKYGVAGFNWTILDHADGKEELDQAERFWIDHYRTIETGYNHREGGSHGAHSEATKEKLRNKPPTFKGKRHTEEAKEKIRAARKLQIYSEAARRKMSQSHIGHVPWNKGTRGIMKAWNKGIRTGAIPWNKGRTNVYTEEMLRRMSLGHSGYKASQDTRQKLRERFAGENNPFYGKRHTEETKRKISETKRMKSLAKEDQSCLAR